MIDRELVRTIDAIRASHPDMEDLYMNGRCYDFFLIIRSLRPNAVAWYDYNVGHVYALVNDRLYDIRGVHPKGAQHRKWMAKLDHKFGHRPHRWGMRDSRRLSLANS